MINPSIGNCSDVYRWWSQAVTHLALSPWRLLDAQCQAGIKMFDVLMTGCLARESRPLLQGPIPMPPVPTDFEKLEHTAAERAREGRAPPREVYEVKNRGRIDWSRFPNWARPSDPELFEGCAHEG
jgi:hypothetical protein